MQLQVKDLTYHYMPGTKFEQVAVDHISVSIESGQFIGLIGHTGSGKSTFMQLLNGLLFPTAGTVYFNGRDIHADKKKLREIRQKVGFVFQYPEHQLFEATVFKDVAFGPENLGLDAGEVAQRVYDALEMVDIPSEYYEKSPFELSGGQKRRVAIAGVLAMKPEVLILDEPAAGLDPKGREDILGRVREMHEKLKMTIILVSHSMEDIARMAEQIIVMHQGKIEMMGTPSEVFKQDERLESLGLSVPQTTTILRMLQECGFDVRTDGFSPESVAQIIADSINRGGKKGTT